MTGRRVLTVLVAGALIGGCATGPRPFDMSRESGSGPCPGLPISRATPDTCDYSSLRTSPPVRPGHDTSQLPPPDPYNPLRPWYRGGGSSTTCVGGGSSWFFWVTC